MEALPDWDLANQSPPDYHRRSAHYLVSLQQWAMGRDDCAGVGLCPSAAWRVVCNDGAQVLGDSDGHLR